VQAARQAETEEGSMVSVKLSPVMQPNRAQGGGVGRIMVVVLVVVVLVKWMVV